MKKRPRERRIKIFAGTTQPRERRFFLLGHDKISKFYLTKKYKTNLLKLFSIAAGTLIFAACDGNISGNSALPSVETTATGTQNLEETITVSGFVKPETSTEIKSEINGRITKILVKNGDSVKEGDLLLEIDPQTYQTTVDSNERTVRQRKLDVEKSERDMKRIKELYENDFATEEDYLNSITDLENNKLQLEIAQAALDNSELELAKTKIVAPHDGMISDLDVYVGNVISGAGSFSSGTTLMKVNDMRTLRVEADLNEIEANKIELGAETRLTFDSLPKTSFTGKVNYLSSFGVQDSSTSTLYKFPVWVNFETGEILVRPGTSANLSILVAKVENALVVPASAIFIEDNSRFVFVKKSEHKFERREVAVGIGNLNFIEIKSGLQLGDVIATTRPSQAEIVDEKGNAVGGKAPKRDKNSPDMGPPM